jgi:protein Xni
MRRASRPATEPAGRARRCASGAIGADLTRLEGDVEEATITLLLVDALNLIRRVYAAQPGEDGPERAQAARVSSVQSLRRALRQCAPTHAACVFDGAGRSWRHELDPGYKEGHAPMPAALGEALDAYRQAFREIGVASLDFPALEADDVVATMAVKATAAGAAVIVLSTDKIFAELLPAGVQVRDHFRGREIDAAAVTAKFGVRPEQLADYLALVGDRGNNIAGVPGVGAKTAARLLSRFATLEELLASAATIEGRLGERLREHAAAARLCRSLVGLRTDLELGVNLRDLRYAPAGA